MLFSIVMQKFQVQHEVIHNPNRTLIVTELKSSVIIMTTVMHVHTFASFKSSVSLVEGFAKWFAEALHECRSDLRDLLAICTACNRAMNRVYTLWAVGAFFQQKI